MSTKQLGETPFQMLFVCPICFWKHRARGQWGPETTGDCYASNNNYSTFFPVLVLVKKMLQRTHGQRRLVLTAPWRYLMSIRSCALGTVVASSTSPHQLRFRYWFSPMRLQSWAGAPCFGSSRWRTHGFSGVSRHVLKRGPGPWLVLCRKLAPT